MTIVDAIKAVLTDADSPQTVEQILASIHGAKLYAFKTANPKSVIGSQLRRHCGNLNIAAAGAERPFVLIGTDRYDLASRHTS